MSESCKFLWFAMSNLRISSIFCERDPILNTYLFRSIVIPNYQGFLDQACV